MRRSPRRASSSPAIRSSSAIQDQTNASYLSLGGGPRRGNGYLIEGVPMTDFINRPTIVPSIEAVEEVRVQTKTYESDMGHSAGGVFNTTARSGSNTWHGSALLVDKPGWATGQLFFAKKAGIANPPQYFRNWAGSVGGPIVKNRTFFWFSTDNYQQLGTRNNVLTLPTALERAGDFSQTRNAAGQPVTIYDPLTTRLNAAGQYVRDPFPGNVIPADRINPVARAMLGAIPTPASGKSFNGVASLLDGPQYQQTIKLDQRWNDAWTTTGMYARQKTREPGSAFFGEFGTIPGDPERQPAAAHGQLLRPQQRLRRRTTRRRSRSATATTTSTTAAPTFRPSTPRRSGLPASYVNQLTYNTFPAMVIAGYGGTDHGRQHRTEQHHAHHPLGQRDGLEAGRPSHAEVRRRISAHRRPTSCPVRRVGRHLQLHAGATPRRARPPHVHRVGHSARHNVRGVVLPAGGQLGDLRRRRQGHPRPVEDRLREPPRNRARHRQGAVVHPEEVRLPAEHVNPASAQARGAKYRFRYKVQPEVDFGPQNGPKSASVELPVAVCKRFDTWRCLAAERR